MVSTDLIGIKHVLNSYLVRTNYALSTNTNLTKLY